MPSVLKIRDKDGNFVGIGALRGDRGKSAYEQAVEAGFEGTEEQFNLAVSSIPNFELHLATSGNPHETTAKDVGALPIEGGKITGEGVVLGDGTGKIASGQNFIQLDVFDDKEDYNNRRKLVLNGVRNAQIPECLLLGSVVNGEVVYYAIYGEHNKPSAMDVGAVSTKGDTMIGALTIDKSTDWGQIILQSVAGHYRALETDDSRVRIDVRDDKLTTGRRYVDILSNVGETSIAKAMKLVQTKDGITKSEYILHTGGINDFIITKLSYTGGASTSKTIPIRKTTQAVIVYGQKGTEPYTVGILMRGMTASWVSVGGDAFPTNGNTLAWTDESVTISSTKEAHSWNLASTEYHYVLLG